MIGSRLRLCGFLCAVGLLWVAGVALAHHPSDRLDEQLVDAGDDLMYGGLDSAQPGPLVVVPHVEGPLPCGVPEEGGYLIPFGEGAGVMFLTNGTHLGVVFDVPADQPLYAAVGVDTGNAVRALLLMEEHAVTLHRMGALVLPEDPGANLTTRWGLLGVPYDLPGDGPHDIEHEIPGGGIQLDYDGDPRGGTFCRSQETGHIAFFHRHDGPQGELRPGALVHAVTLLDAHVPHFLPRPVDESTSIGQWNLYVSKAGEDPDRLQAALSSSPAVDDVVPLVLLVVAGSWFALAGRGGSGGSRRRMD